MSAPYWASTPSEELALASDEYRAKGVGELAWLQRVADEIDDEIARRISG